MRAFVFCFVDDFMTNQTRASFFFFTRKRRQRPKSTHVVLYNGQSGADSCRVFACKVCAHMGRGGVTTWYCAISGPFLFFADKVLVFAVFSTFCSVWGCSTEVGPTKIMCVDGGMWVRVCAKYGCKRVRLTGSNKNAPLREVADFLDNPETEGGCQVGLFGKSARCEKSMFPESGFRMGWWPEQLSPRIQRVRKPCLDPKKWVQHQKGSPMHGQTDFVVGHQKMLCRAKMGRTHYFGSTLWVVIACIVGHI